MDHWSPMEEIKQNVKNGITKAALMTLFAFIIFLPTLVLSWFNLEYPSKPRATQSQDLNSQLFRQEVRRLEDAERLRSLTKAWEKDDQEALRRSLKEKLTDSKLNQWFEQPE